MFICKLVDESTKDELDEVEFQYKQGTDTYETLQDRLQRLHRDGMEKFMKEKIYYVSSNYPEWLFSTYTGSKRKKAIEDLQNTIRILKFYSNNDFAFKDVHNKELFYQNGKILVEMVQLFEKYKIVYQSKHQFLGDMFEQLLNKGFKQNEGQFFTPMPITRFIWDCLPIERVVKSDRGTIYPKIIDYACGAGHFLTEAVEAINCFVPSDGSNEWTRDCIYGIEKDYRLARVAKISLFMNGAGEGNIIFGDGLENEPDKGIDNGLFDILVANPPYSVKDFKQHLQLKNNDFQLLNRISANGNEIETLFIERIAQLLKPKGIAAVVLPISILSNDKSSYIGAREVLLNNFLIRAIVSLGSKTFGATGTNTVVLFLEKFNEPPKQIDLAADSINAIFSGNSLKDWKDKDIFEQYLLQINVAQNDYRQFLCKTLSINELKESSYFKNYIDSFFSSSILKDLKKSKSFNKKEPEEQKEICLNKFYDFALRVEREKLFYFSLIYCQTTVIVTAPKNNKEQKEFLGYDWSNRKGNEGIQIIAPGGKLYSDKDRLDTNTIAHAIKQSFLDEFPTLTAEQQKYTQIYSTKDLFNFSRSTFTKSISLSAAKAFISKSKYPLIVLKDIPGIKITKGSALTEAETTPDSGKYKVVAGGKTFAYMYEEYNRNAGVITISASGANAGFVNYWNEKIWASDCSTIEHDDKNILLWIYFYLKTFQTNINLLQRGQAQPHVYVEDIEAILIPDLNSISITSIVDKCKVILDNRRNIASVITNHKKRIEALYSELDNLSEDRTEYRLSDADGFNISIGKRVLNKDLIPNGQVPVYSANVKEPFGYLDKTLFEDFSKPSVLWGIDGDWITNLIPAETKFYPTDHCGVLRCNLPEINPLYLVHVLQQEGERIGFSRDYRASIDRIKGLTISVPKIDIQNTKINEIEKLKKKIEELELSLTDLENEVKTVIETSIH